MTAFEKLLAVADDETMGLLRRMVPKRELALFMAKTITSGIGTTVNVDEVAAIFGINKKSAYNRILKVDPLK